MFYMVASVDFFENEWNIEADVTIYYTKLIVKYIVGVFVLRS